MVVDSGWQYDQDNTAYGLSQFGPWTFTVGAGQTDRFSLADSFIPGDIYTVTVSGDASYSASSNFSALPLDFNDNLGPAAPFLTGSWLNAAYSHLRLDFTTGSYSIDVVDTSSVGYPAGFGLRLDGPGVPEPATWALMLTGFGLAGVALRRRAALTA